MALKIYTIPVSLYCAKLRILLRHKQLEWEELPPPNGYGSAEYMKLVPAGNLPALDHEGLLLGDSEAVAEYLNEIFLEPEMLPGTAMERAKLRELSRFHDTRLEPTLRTLFPHIGGNRETESISQQWCVLQKRLEQIEPLLPQRDRPLTLADCGLPVTNAWIEALTQHFNMKPVLSDRMQAYLTRLSNHSAVAVELAEYRPRLNEWLKSQ